MTMVEETNSKKWVLFGLAGAVVVLSVSGAFIPSAREYIVSIVKILLGAIPSIAQ